MISFTDIPVSTQTFTVKTNIVFNTNLEHVFEKMHLTDDIITIKYKQNIKGQITSKKKTRRVVVSKNFLNCVSLVVSIDKKINVKIFKNGVFQLTGCKNLTHAKKSMYIIICYLQNNTILSLTFDIDGELVFYFKSAMRNIDFELGYKINREDLAYQLHLNTTINIPPISCTNMGVKLKLPINLGTLPIYKMVFVEYPNHTVINYSDCFSTINTKHMSEEEQRQKMSRFVSICIFQNGKVTFSCADENYQEQYYNWFVDIMENIEPFIVKRVSEKKSFYDD